MNLTYKLTLLDFKAAWRLHRRQKFSRRISPYLWPLMTIACLVGAVVFSVTKNMQLLSVCIAVGAGTLTISLVRPILRAWTIRASFKRLFHPKHPDRTSIIDVNDERILRELSGMSELKIPWSGVYSVAGDEKITLIYTNKDCFLMIPTQAMSADQRTELNDLVARNLVKR